MRTHTRPARAGSRIPGRTAGGIALLFALLRTRSPAKAIAAAGLILAAFAPPGDAAVVRQNVIVDPGSAELAAQNLGLGDLEVRVGRQPIPVLGVEPVGEWRVVVVVDGLLSETRFLRGAIADLAASAADLVALGRVEVVIAGIDTRLAVTPTRDPLELEESLTWLGLRATGRGEQLAIRRRFVEEFELGALAAEPGSALAATADQMIARLAAGLREALRDEAEAVGRRRSVLLRWALEQPVAAPTLLVLVSAGADARALDFYGSALAAAGLEDATAGVTDERPRLAADDLAQALAVTTGPVLVFSPPAGERAAAGIGAEGRREEDVETVVQDGQLVDRAMLGRVDPRDLLRGGKSGERLRPRLVSPRDELETLAQATGGELVADREALRLALSSFSRRLEVRLEPAAPGWEPQPVEVRTRDAGGTEQAILGGSPWLARALPRAAAEELALAALEEGLGEGDLAASAQLVPEAAVSRLVVEVDGLGSGGVSGSGSPLRITIASAGDGSPQFDQVVVAAAAVEAGPGGEAARVETRTALRPGDVGAVVCLVEELASGRWGIAYPALGNTAGPGAPGLLLPTPRAVHLLEPETSVVFGSTLFEVVYDSRVAAVEYIVDGRPAARSATPPFAARLDLGPLPEPHRVEVVAYDAAGIELARDLLQVNDSGTALRVRIVRPEPAAAAPDRQPLIGPVEVEVRVELPRGEQFDRLEFYWNEELVATRFAPPFSQWISIPEDAPKGFFRVVGFLADGSSSEDVLFVNSPGASERIRVELVELFAVVTDGSGRPLQGVAAERFEIYENGERQDIATFSEARDRPLAVGLALDASASMFRKLPQVKQAAATFLRALNGGKDRAFVVDFGREPRLQHDLSRDLEAVESAIGELEAEGRTAIWKGITFALVQLQGVTARKALVVFSDGADEDPDFSFRTCLKFARRVGVPVYVIVSNNEIYRTQGRGLNVRGFMHRLESLTRSVGGRVFLTRVGEDLESIYGEINEELRSQYVLGYYARDVGESGWRSLRVEVDEPGARVRAAAGYFR